MNVFHILSKWTKRLGEGGFSRAVCFGALFSLLALAPAYLAAQGVIGPVRKGTVDKPKDREYWAKRLRPGTIPTPRPPRRAPGDKTKPVVPRATPRPPLVKQYPNGLDLVVVGEVGKVGSSNGHFVLTRLELERMISSGLGDFSTEGLQPQVARSVENSYETALHMKLQEWCVLKSIVIYARRNGLSVSPDEVDVKLAEMRQQYGEQLIDRELEKSALLVGVDKKLIRDGIAEGLLVDKFIIAQIGRRSPRDLEMIYRMAPARYATPMFVHAWQIFKRIDPLMSESEKKDLRKEIYALRKSIVGGTFLRRKGKDFEEVAREESDHPVTAERGGDMGWMNPSDALSSEIWKALFTQTKQEGIKPALEKGEVSKIVETTEGYYLFRITETRPPTGLTFDAHARERVINELILRYKQEVGPQLMAAGIFPVRMNASGLRLIGEPYKVKKQTLELSPPALPPL